jgi:translation initiation factor IF-2
MKNNFLKISLFISIIFFVFLSVVSVFLYREIKNNNQKTRQNIIKWQAEASRREEITSLNHSLQKITDERTQLENHFAKSSDVVPFLDTLEKLAPKVGALAEVDSVDTPADNIGLMVGLKTSGSFEAIYKFLTLLENSPYELNILSMDMHKMEVGDVSSKNIKNSKWEAVFKIQLLSFVP